MRISPRYFIIEFITGLLFIAFWWTFARQYSTQLATHAGMLLLAMAWIWASTMLVTFMIDLDTTYVIEPVTWVGMAAGLIFEFTTRFLNHQPWFSIVHLGGISLPYVDAIPGMIVGFVIFQLFNLFGWLIFRKPGMGLGDSFIGAAIGALLGLRLALLSFALAVITGAVIGIILLLLDKIAPAPAPGTADSASDGALRETGAEAMPPGRYMPFGPFLTASAVLLALLPGWVTLQTQHLWHWYMHFLIP